MTLNPFITPSTPVARTIGEIADLRRRVGILERRSGGGDTTIISGSTITPADTNTVELDLSGSSVLTGLIPTTATPELMRVGLGTAAGASGTGATIGSAVSGRVWTDQALGEHVQHFGVGNPGIRYDIRHGTAAAPVTAEGPTLKVSRKEGIPSTSQGAEFVHYSAVLAQNLSIGDSEAQSVGVSGTARSESTVIANGSTHNPDACGMIGHGTIGPAGRGVGMGGHFEALTSSTVGGYAKAIELQARNATGSPATYSTSSLSSICGAWIVLNDDDGGGGIEFGNPFNQKWDVGISFKSANGGPCLDASIEDNGTAAYSYLINGTHATAAIAIAATAGKFLVGVTTTAATTKSLIRSDADGNHALLVMPFSSGATVNTFQVSDSSNVEQFGVGPTGNTRVLKGLQLIGTGGASYIEMLEQSSTPSTPATSDRLRHYAVAEGTSSASARPEDTVLRSVDASGVVRTNLQSLGDGSPVHSVPVQNAITGHGTRTPVAGSIYWVALRIPQPCVLTGISIALQTVGAATHKVIVALYDANGQKVANSATAGTDTSTATVNQWFDVAFTATKRVSQAGTYYIAVQFDTPTGASSVFYALANGAGTSVREVAGSTTGTFGTLPAITPGTSRTANVGPLAHTY